MYPTHLASVQVQIKFRQVCFRMKVVIILLAPPHMDVALEKVKVVSYLTLFNLPNNFMC